MSDSGIFRFANNGQAKIEAMIRAARHYVQPSDELRPRVMEAAREQCRDRRAEQKLGAFAIAVLVLVIVSSPLFRYVTLIQSETTQRSENEIQSRAEVLAEEPTIGSQFALAEAVSEWRQVQATRLHRHTKPKR